MYLLCINLPAGLLITLPFICGSAHQLRYGFIRYNFFQLILCNNWGKTTLKSEEGRIDSNASESKRNICTYSSAYLSPSLFHHFICGFHQVMKYLRTLVWSTCPGGHSRSENHLKKVYIVIYLYTQVWQTHWL